MPHQQHTPEPWHIAPDGTLAHTSKAMGVTVGILPMERFRPNLERAVACVNACAGIADPAEAIRKAREALQTAWGILATAGDNGHPGATAAAAVVQSALAGLRGQA